MFFERSIALHTCTSIVSNCLYSFVPDLSVLDYKVEIKVIAMRPSTFTVDSTSHCYVHYFD